MSNFINRTTLEYRSSAADSEHPDPPWLLVAPGSPSATVIATVPAKYWKIVVDAVVEQSAGEKAATDAAILDAVRAASRQGAIDAFSDNVELGHQARGVAEHYAGRVNLLISRLGEVTAALLALQASGGNAGNRLDALPTSYSSIATKNKATVIAEIETDLAAGNQDI